MLGLASLWLLAAAFDGKTQLQRSCTACHNLDAITARRLPREDWALELDKMVSMGARIKNRKALLDYLSTTYGPGK